jgi:hypothetical protein
MYRAAVASEGTLVSNEKREEGNQQRAVSERPENDLHRGSFAHSRRHRMTVW